MDTREKLECKCCTCNGSGRVQHPELEERKITCPDCFGQGTVLDDHYGKTLAELLRTCKNT